MDLAEENVTEVFSRIKKKPYLLDLTTCAVEKLQFLPKEMNGICYVLNHSKRLHIWELQRSVWHCIMVDLAWKNVFSFWHTCFPYSSVSLHISQFICKEQVKKIISVTNQHRLPNSLRFASTVVGSDFTQFEKVQSSSLTGSKYINISNFAFLVFLLAKLLMIVTVLILKFTFTIGIGKWY